MAASVAASGASRRALDLGMQELRACRAETIAADVAIARAMDLTALASALRVPALIAGSRLSVVDGPGHMLPIEAPSVVNREIAGFIRSLTPGPARAGAEAPAPRSSRLARALQWLVALVRGG